MEREITSIPLVKANSGIPCYIPVSDATLIDENDHAIRVMTDFKTVIPITIEANVNIDIALNKMRNLDVRLLFVTDDLDNSNQ